MTVVAESVPLWVDDGRGESSGKPLKVGSGGIVKRDSVRIVRLPVMLPRWAAAQVILPGRIFVRRGARLGSRLLAHELVHVEQLRRMGLLRYWWTYLQFLLRCGYREHPLELDAVVRSAEPRFLERASELLAAAERSERGTPPISSGRTLDLH